MQVDETKLLDLIRESGLVSKTDLGMFLKKAKETNKNVGTLLVEEGKLTEKVNPTRKTIAARKEM